METNCSFTLSVLFLTNECGASYMVVKTTTANSSDISCMLACSLCVCVSSPVSLCMWGQRCPPPDIAISRSQTPCTPGYCSPRCSEQPGPGEHNSFLPGT